MPLLVAAIIRAPANYRVVHLVIFSKYFSPKHPKNPLFVNRNVHVIKNSTYDLLSHSDAAFVASGTATLETALFKVPQIVCYKTSKLNYLIAKKIIKLRFISLVNLIFNEEMVKERVQDSCNSKNLVKDLKKLIDNSKRKSHNNYMTKLEKLLGNGGASNKVANLIYTRTRA